MTQVTPIHVDPIQRVRVAFLSSSHSQDIQIELIEPISEDSPVHSFLAKSGGLHHLCFSVPDIKLALAEISRDKACRVIVPPTPGAGHDQRLISFFYVSTDCPRGHLMELVEIK